MSGDSSSSQKPEKMGRKEETPEGPQEKEPPSGEKPEPEGEDPQGGGENPEPTPARPAEKSPDQETQDPLQVLDDRDQWGNLPIHLRELFRAEGGRAMPARYRDWIDSYYKKLNRRSVR